MALEGRRTPGEAKSDIEIMSLIFTRLRKMYQDEGGKYPDPIVNLSWPYSNPQSPTAEELAKEYSGKALADLADPRIRPRSRARPASSWPPSPSCATTVPPPAAAGSSLAPGARRAT